MARWASEKKDWLNTWLDLPDGRTPSRDCIRTFFGKVDSAAFQACFFDCPLKFPGISQRFELVTLKSTRRGLRL